MIYVITGIVGGMMVGFGTCAILAAGARSDLEATIWFMRQQAIKGLDSFHSNNTDFVETALTEIRDAE